MKHIYCAYFLLTDLQLNKRKQLNIHNKTMHPELVAYCDSQDTSWACTLPIPRTTPNTLCT